MKIDSAIVQQCTLDDNKTVMLTVTNKGYLLYTMNMLKSLRAFGLDHRVLLLCVDPEAAHILTKQGYGSSVHCLDLVDYKGFRAWNSKGYDYICYLKLSAIHHFLCMDRNVWLMDGDLVFCKDPLPDIYRASSDPSHDLWIQNDGIVDHDRSNLCTGYLWIRSTAATRERFDCTTDTGKRQYDTTCALDNNDQTFINQYVLPYIGAYGVFPLHQYPNGQYYYKYIPTDMVLVHFNWVRGHVKMAKMKEHQMWLLSEDEEEQAR